MIFGRGCPRFHQCVALILRWHGKAHDSQKERLPITPPPLTTPPLTPPPLPPTTTQPITHPTPHPAPNHTIHALTTSQSEALTPPRWWQYQLAWWYFCAFAQVVPVHTDRLSAESAGACHAARERHGYITSAFLSAKLRCQCSTDI